MAYVSSRTEPPPLVLGSGAGSTGTGSSPTYTPAPWGASYGDEGLVYGLGGPGAYTPPRNYLVPRISENRGANEFFGKRSVFFPGGNALSATELGRAATWIIEPGATAEEKKRYQEYVDKFFPNGAGFEDYRGLWAAAAEYASTTNRNNPSARWSPFDALENMWKLFQETGGASGGGRSGSVSTNSSTSITQTSKEDADAYLDQALTSLLGRTATAAEKSKFLGVLNAKERANPSTGTSRTVSDGQGNSKSTSSSVNRGVNPSAVAADWATEQEGFAEYQVATTYLDAMLDALSSPV